MEATAHNLGPAITNRLAAVGQSKAWLAARSEVDERQLSRVMAGAGGLSIASLSRIAGALGCHPADILRESIPSLFAKGSPRKDHAAATRTAPARGTQGRKRRSVQPSHTRSMKRPRREA